MIETIESSRERRLVIEAPNRCLGNGCAHDVTLFPSADPEWRESVSLSFDTSIDYARVLLERHTENHPKSGPYRLVEYVTTIKRTKEVIT